MNGNKSRKLEEVLSLLGKALDIINEIREDLEDDYYNMSQNIQESEHDEEMYESLSALENAAGSISTIASNINDILD